MIKFAYIPSTQSRLLLTALVTFFYCSPLHSEDYQFKLVEWIEADAGGQTLHKGETHRGVPLLRGQSASLGPGSRMELVGSLGEMVRLGDETSFTLLHDRQVRLSRGEMLLCLPPSESMPFRIQGPSTSFHLDNSGTIVTQVTANGGMKLVCLSGHPRLLVGSHSALLQPGRVYFLPPGQPRLGRNILIDLSLFIRTSALIQEFPGKLPTHRQMQKTAFLQAISIKKRTRLFVGDATSSDSLDLLLIEN
ncbi:MAG: hypothetical protein HN467_04005 [Opitutae bacterium]|nr:hypothetical protein [Opitutae bacterium]